MAFPLLQLGIRRTVPILAQNALLRRCMPLPTASASRTFMSASRSLTAVATCTGRTPPTTVVSSSSPILNQLRQNRLLFRMPSLSRALSSSSKQNLRYHPPPRKPQSFLDSLSDNTIIYGILGLNVLVVAMWYMSEQKLVRTRQLHAIPVPLITTSSRESTETHRH